MLEQQLIEKGTTWIDSVSYDPDARQLVIKLIALAPDDAHASLLTFRNVQNYSSIWSDPTDELRSCSDGEDLIGLDEQVQAEGIEYAIITDCRSIVFFTSREPKLEASGIAQQ